MSPWRYESDGEIVRRTHYAYRQDESKPCGTDRIDFKTAKQAMEFVRRSNALILRILNS